MLDFAVNDNRSVAAMLRGKGDGREKAWLRFEGKHQAMIDQEQLQLAFAKEVRYGRVNNRREDTIRKIKKALWIALGVMVIAS